MKTTVEIRMSSYSQSNPIANDFDSMVCASGKPVANKIVTARISVAIKPYFVVLLNKTLVIVKPNDSVKTPNKVHFTN